MAFRRAQIFILVFLLATVTSAQKPSDDSYGIQAAAACSNTNISNDNFMLCVNYYGEYWGWTDNDDDDVFDSTYERIFFQSSTGFTTFRIGGTTYKSGENLDTYLTQNTTRLSSTRTRTAWNITPKNLEVMQDLEILADNIKVTMKLRNVGVSTISDIDLRLFWDTMVGTNDGAPLKEHGGNFHSTEYELFPDSTIKFWTAAENTTSGALSVTSWWDPPNPDRIIFAQWAYANDNPYNYTINILRSITDSSVSMYWENISLSSGDEQSIVVYYGTFTQTVADTVNINVTTDKSTYYTDGTNSEPVTVTANVWDDGGNPISGLNALDHFTATIGSTSYTTSNFNDHGGGEYVFQITPPTTTGSKTLRVNVTRASDIASNTTSFTMSSVNLGVESQSFEGYLDEYKNASGGVETETPVFYRTKAVKLGVRLNSTSDVDAMKGDISVIATVVDVNDTTNRLPVNVTGYYTGNDEWRVTWRHFPVEEYPVGKYNMTVYIKYKGMAAQTLNKNFYLVYKEPSGYTTFTDTDQGDPVVNHPQPNVAFVKGKRHYRQYDKRIWQLAMDWASGTKDVNETVEVISRLIRTINGNSTYHHAQVDERNEFNGNGYDENADGADNASDNWTHNYEPKSGKTWIADTNSWYTDSGGNHRQMAWFKDAIVFQQLDFDPEDRIPHRHPVGVCDDYAGLTVAYLRAVKIPAKEISPFGYYDSNTFGHAATQYYYNDSWRHLDTDYTIEHDDWLQDRFNPLVYAEGGVLFSGVNNGLVMGVFTENSTGGINNVGQDYQYNYSITSLELTDGVNNYNYSNTVNYRVTLLGAVPREVKLVVFATSNCASDPGTKTILERTYDNISGNRIVSSSYTLPTQTWTEWITGSTCDVRLQARAYMYLNRSVYYDTKNVQVPGLSIVQSINMTVDGNAGEHLIMSEANSTNYNVTANWTSSEYVFNDRANSTSEFRSFTKNYNFTNYTLFKWSVENLDDSQHNFSLTVPIYAWGNSLFSPDLGNVTSWGTIGNTTSYIVFYDNSNTSYVTVYIFSENITVVEKQNFTHEEISGLNVTIVHNMTLEAGKYDEIHGYISRRPLDVSFENTYQNMLDDISANGDSLLDMKIAVNLEYKPGDTLSVQVNVTTLHLNETLNLTVNADSITELREEMNITVEFDNITVSTYRGMISSYTANATIPNSTEMGNWRVEVKTISTSTELREKEQFTMEDAFDISTAMDSTIVQNSNITFNVTVNNTWPKAVNNVTIEIDLHGNFDTSENLTSFYSSLASGTTAIVNYTLNVTTDNTTYVTVTVSSLDGGADSSDVTVNISGLPDLDVQFNQITSVNANETFNLTANVTNTGGLTVENVSLNLTGPSFVNVSSTLVYLGNISAGEMKQATWQLQTNQTDDFSLLVNATDSTGTYTNRNSVSISTNDYELNLTCSLSAEVDKGDTTNLTCSVENRGGLNLTNVQINLTLPSELTTTGATVVNYSSLAGGIINNITWVLTGANAGYGQLSVTATASEVSTQTYQKTVTVRSFDFTLNIDSSSYDSGVTVQISINLTNNNTEVSYSDLVLNYTINSSTQNISLTEQTIYSLGPSANVSKGASWDTTGYDSGTYTLTIDLMKAGTTIASQSTSFTVGAEADYALITLAAGWNLISFPLIVTGGGPVSTTTSTTTTSTTTTVGGETTTQCPVVEDAMFDEDQTRDGTETFIIADYLDGTGELPFFKFNISSIPASSTVSSSTLCLYVQVSSDNDLDVWYVENQTWEEGDIDSLCSDGVICNDIWNLFTTNITTYNGNDTSSVWYCISGLQSAVQTEVDSGNPFVSFAFNNTDSVDVNDYYEFSTRETSGGANAPYLNVTYT